MPFTVAPAAADELVAACRLLSASRPGPLQESAAGRYLDLFASGEFDRAGLFVARDQGRSICGAMLVQPLAGGLGLAWPPRAGRRRDAADIEDALAATACRWLQSRGVRVCQVFGAEADRAEFASLSRHGFRRVTQITHQRRELSRDDERGFEAVAAPLAFERFNPDDRDRIASTLLATYEGSQDCPELNGCRTAAELLSGFSGAPGTPPSWWFVARNGGEPVGVVVFDAGTEPRALELNYLGLVPAVRGRGWGDWMVRFALHFAAGEESSALTLSVDVRNEPALRLYARHGFHEYDRRDVYLVSWS